jgi:urease accessory protein
MTASLPWLPFLLQTADALFPTGAYAHSLGFEESVRLGLVKCEDTLGDYLLGQIVPSLQELELPYLSFASAAAAEDDLAELCVLDREIGAWKLAFEVRQASAQLGVRRLKALRLIGETPLLERFAGCVDRGEARGHHLVVYALGGSAGQAPLAALLAAYFYQTLAAVCAAALKLFRIGQDGCQRALRRACLLAGPVLERAPLVPRNEAGWFNPLLEIASMRHEFADERLFIS